MGRNADSFDNNLLAFSLSVFSSSVAGEIPSFLNITIYSLIWYSVCVCVRVRVRVCVCEHIDITCVTKDVNRALKCKN